MKEKLKAILNKITSIKLLSKRPLYVVLTIIFSLVIVLDAAIMALVPQTAGFAAIQTMGTQISDFSDADFSADMAAGDAAVEDDASASDSADTTADDAAASDSTDTTEDASGSDDTASDSSDTAADDADADSATGDMTMPSGGAMPDMDDVDGESFSAEDFDGTVTMPDMSDMDGESFSAEDFDGTVTVPDMSDAEAETSVLADATDGSSDSTGGTGTTAVTSVSGVFRMISFLQAVKSHGLVILIIAMILDALSIFMLVRLTRQKHQEEEAARMEELSADGEVHLVRPKQKKKSSGWVWVIPVVGLVLLVLLVQTLSSSGSTTSAQTEESVYSEEASTGDISTVLPGTGTLEEEDAVAVSLPSEVEILEWYVSNGDTVEAGDKLALVDTVSVMSAIASVQESLDALDEELASYEDEETTSELTASAGARVKVIYASEDDSVIDVMYENGALMLLSLDGLMAVDIETDAELSVGDTVTVTLSDGTQEEGTVESYLNGTAVITITDDGPENGDSVTVADDDGATLGTGTLYIHSELKLMAYSGTIEDVEVSEEDEVDSGDTLISLSDVDNSVQSELLLTQREELEEQMQTLITLYTEQYVYAETAGVISGLSVTSTASTDDSTDDTDSTDGDSDSSNSSADDTDSEASVGSSVTATSAEVTTGTTAETVVTTLASTTNVAMITTLSSVTDSTTESTEETAQETETTTYVNYIGVVTAVDEEGNVTLALRTTAYEITDYNDYSAVTLTDTDETISLILSIASLTVYDEETGEWTTTEEFTCATDDILLLVYDASLFTESTDDTENTTDTDSTQETETTDAAEELLQELTGLQVTEVLDISWALTVTQTSEAADETQTESGSTDDVDTGSADGGMEGQTAYGTDASAMADSTGTDISSLDASALAGLTGSDTSSAAAAATTTESTTAETTVTETLSEEISSTYGVEETTWCSVTPQETMTVTITIDELDILSLAVGQEAEVTLDAFPGQSFTGVVESINTSGTNSGGNSKYTAVISIDREEDMLAGMNASVKITLDTTEDVICIPEEALVEDETGVYVYTSYDENTDTLGDPVEVTTGVSDGTTVEILSGLAEGDTYWYKSLDTVNYSSAYSSGSSTIDFSSFMGGGGGF